MEKENKILWVIGIVTIAIIGFGAYFLSRPPSPQDESKSSLVDSKLLVKSDSNIKKAPNEKAVLVEFGDFQCPACASYAPVVTQIEEEFNEELTFVARNFPLTQHKNALPSAYAAEASGKQGKYWEMYDLLYKNQKDWEGLSNPMEIFNGYAESLGLDMKKFKDDVSLKEIKDKVQSDYSDGMALGVNSTPTFFLNGEKIKSPKSFEEFKVLIQAAIINSPTDTNSSSEISEEYHAHFDLKVYLDGKLFDFSLPKYQSQKGKLLAEWVHLHDGNGDIVHIHHNDIKLSELFSSINIGFNNLCFTSDSGSKYCNTDGKTLKMYVNGTENKDFENYQPRDLDRILISFGSETGDVIQKQVESVSDVSCIYSEKCPERGKPPTEDCVGGLGTGCDKE